MKITPFLVLSTFFLAGCTSNEAPLPSEDVEPTPEAPFLPPRQLLSKEESRCRDLLKDPQTFEFSVDEGYDILEVSFHASGLGQVGYQIVDQNGTKVTEKPNYNPTNTPCEHSHKGEPDELTVKPGTYRATVENLGILGWHFLINERSSSSNNSTEHGSHQGH